MFNNPATTQIYTLSLHDALPILINGCRPKHGTRKRYYCLLQTNGWRKPAAAIGCHPGAAADFRQPDRKSTRLNSSHVAISYAVFCLKKKTKRIPYATPAPGA